MRLLKITSARPRQSSPPPSSDLAPVHDLEPKRRPYGTKGLTLGPQALLYAPGGPFTQPTDPGHDDYHLTQDVIPRQWLDDDMEMGDIFDIQPDDGKRQGRKEKQWNKWQELIPEMLGPYLHLLEETKSLRNRPTLADTCSGCKEGSKLEVICIYFESKTNNISFSVKLTFVIGIKIIQLCSCAGSPALQLISRGLFPCAPIRPSLAVDLNMLDFVRGLFVNLAPNTTAWCETLEGFLSSRNYKLTTQVCILFNSIIILIKFA